MSFKFQTRNSGSRATSRDNPRSRNLDDLFALEMCFKVRASNVLFHEWKDFRLEASCYYCSLFIEFSIYYSMYFGICRRRNHRYLFVIFVSLSDVFSIVSRKQGYFAIWGNLWSPPLRFFYFLALRQWKLSFRKNRGWTSLYEHFRYRVIIIFFHSFG